MNKYVKIIIGVAVVVGLGIAGTKKIQDARAKDAAQPQAKIYPIVVSSLSPKLTDVRLTLPYLAEVQNDKDVKLSSRIAARILDIKSSGTSVKKGEVLVHLDTTDIKSGLASLKEQIIAANVSLKNLELTHQRTLDLVKVKGASIEESQKEITLIANAFSQVASLKQKEIELNNNLSYSTITSPVNGVIAKTYESKGAMGMPGQALVSISSKNGFYLLVRTPTSTPILGVEFEKKSYKATALGSTYHGLSEYKVYTGDTHLTTGDRVEVNVITFEQKAMLLPFDAILSRDAKSYVLVIDKNQAQLEEVHIVQSAEQGVVIAESLEGKNIVIAKPDILLKLTSGSMLQVKE
ncbi:MAG: multidrug efflux pump subunit AcrA (membrane-fusion protein) [Sulfurimonas sp.]|jgi:multidrug efflux pump subunit AcrA (membrane-fusion protein)